MNDSPKELVAELNTLISGVAASLKSNNEQLKNLTKNTETFKKQLLKLKNLRSKARRLKSGN